MIFPNRDKVHVNNCLYCKSLEPKHIGYSERSDNFLVKKMKCNFCGKTWLDYTYTEPENESEILPRQEDTGSNNSE